MRKLLFLLLISVSCVASAQSDTVPVFKYEPIQWVPVPKDTVIVRDTVIQKDTMLQPMYEKYDTAKATLIYLVGRGKVCYTLGYVIRKGFLFETAPGVFNWYRQPEVVGFLNTRKRKIDKVIQIL